MPAASKSTENLQAVLSQRLPRTLWQKSLIVIALPVILDVLFMVSLGFLIHLADNDVKSARGQFEILKCCQDIEVNYGVLLTLQTSFLPGNSHPPTKDEARGLINDISGDLGRLLEFKPARAEALERIAQLQQELCCNPALSRPWEVARRPEIIPRASNFAIDLTNELQSLAGAAEARLHERLVDQRKLREQIGLVIICGVAFNIALAISLAIFFSKSITSRIKILSENTERLALGQPLNEPMQGKDEIALLDRAFHEMASALHRTLNELSESQKSVASVIENMPVGLITADHEAVIESANPRAARITGYEEGQLAGIPLQKLIPALGRAEDIETLEQSQTHRQELKSYFLITKEGKKIPIDLSITELPTSKGRALLSSVQDISQRKKIEQLKREFVTMVGEDLKAPLVSVEAALKDLSQGRHGHLLTSTASNVASTQDTVSRLIALINDLLDIEKLDSGKLKMQIRDTSILSVLERSVLFVAPVAALKGIAVDVPDTKSRVLADEDRLVQVVVNLLSNALKFSPPRSKISIKVIDLPDSVQVRISDCGPGVPEGYAERIFDRFQQADLPAGDCRQGSGLGLTICRSIVEELQGSIGVDSETSSGSTFWFAIPSSHPSGETAPCEHATSKGARTGNCH